MTSPPIHHMGGSIYIGLTPITYAQAEDLMYEMRFDFAVARNALPKGSPPTAAMASLSKREAGLRMVIEAARQWRLAAGHTDPHTADPKITAPEIEARLWVESAGSRAVGA